MSIPIIKHRAWFFLFAIGFAFFVWVTILLIRSRMELYEARQLIADLFVRSVVINDCCKTGRAQLAIERSLSNQFAVVQYVIRRRVRNTNLPRVVNFVVAKKGLDLGDEKLLLFDQYYNDYKKSFDSTGEKFSFSYLEAQLYHNWGDSLERWTTWKPHDGTNIKVGWEGQRNGRHEDLKTQLDNCLRSLKDERNETGEITEQK